VKVASAEAQQKCLFVNSFSMAPAPVCKDPTQSPIMCGHGWLSIRRDHLSFHSKYRQVFQNTKNFLSTIQISEIYLEIISGFRFPLHCVATKLPSFPSPRICFNYVF